MFKIRYKIKNQVLGNSFIVLEDQVGLFLSNIGPENLGRKLLFVRNCWISARGWHYLNKIYTYTKILRIFYYIIIDSDRISDLASRRRRRKGSLRSETVKCGCESQGSRIRERLRWQGPAACKKDRPLLSSERAPHKNKTVTVKQ
jgi:hypothetical protein